MMSGVELPRSSIITMSLEKRLLDIIGYTPMSAREIAQHLGCSYTSGIIKPTLMRLVREEYLTLEKEWLSETEIRNKGLSGSRHFRWLFSKKY